MKISFSGIGNRVSGIGYGSGKFIWQKTKASNAEDAETQRREKRNLGLIASHYCLYLSLVLSVFIRVYLWLTLLVFFASSALLAFVFCRIFCDTRIPTPESRFPNHASRSKKVPYEILANGLS